MIRFVGTPFSSAACRCRPWRTHAARSAYSATRCARQLLRAMNMITGTGTRMRGCRSCPGPTRCSRAGSPRSARSPDKSNVKPRKTVSPPSVTTNAGTRSRLITSPCSGAAGDADGDRRGSGQVDRIACLDAVADREPVGQAALGDIGADHARRAPAASRPTGRCPQSGSTKVMPMATSPEIDTCRARSAGCTASGTAAPASRRR